MRTLEYSTRISKKQIVENQLAKEARDNYIEELNVNMMLTFESMSPAQQIKDYGTTNLNEIKIN